MNHDLIDVRAQREADEWCDRIRTRWQDSVEGIIDCGQMLETAKAALKGKKGAWEWMFSIANRNRLPFTDRTARMLKASALWAEQHGLIANRNHGSALPASWRTLYELSRLPDDIFLPALEDGRIRPDMERKDVKALLPKKHLLNANWRDHVGSVDDDIERNVVLGDFREMCADIPDESVDLVFCDPPYDRDSVHLYGDAATAAMRILRPGGSFMAYGGQYLLHAILAGCSGAGLRYWWMNAIVHSGQKARMTEYGIVVHWKPLVWFVKGTRGDKQTFIDDIATGDREKDTHEWQQSVEEAAYYIARLSSPRGTVVDFFCGGGTTALAADRLGRSWRTYEIDAATRDSAIGRIQLDRRNRVEKAA